MNKRGDFAVVVGILVLLVTLLALGYFLFRANEFKEEAEDREICRTTVVARSATEVPIFSPEGVVPLRCKTTYDTISATDEFAIKKQLAGLMTDCWWQMNEGNSDLFGPVPAGQQRCKICSVISFTPDLAYEYPQGLAGFSDYLVKEHIPGTDQTYFSYFTKNPEAEGFYTDLNTEERDVIDLRQKYAVLVSSADRTTMARFATVVGSGTALSFASLGFVFGPVGAGVGAIVGLAGSLYYSDQFADTTYTSLQLVPYGDRIGEVCSSLG